MANDFNQFKLSKFQSECLRKSIQQIVAEQMPITVRGIYYQCVVDKRLPFVTKDKTGSFRNYRLVAKRVLDLRREGLISWDAVVDPSRNYYDKQRWPSPAAFAQIAPRLYRRDYWATATARPVVLVEKDGQVAVYEQFANRYGVDVRSCQGYGSASHLWSLAQYIEATRQDVTILVCADWDPSGCDWPRAAESELAHHLVNHNRSVVFNRVLIDKTDVADLGQQVALQVSDSRDPRVSKWLLQNGYGAEDEAVVEMDAMSPNMARQRIGDAIEKMMSVEGVDLSKNSELEKQERCRIGKALSLFVDKVSL